MHFAVSPTHPPVGFFSGAQAAYDRHEADRHGLRPWLDAARLARQTAGLCRNRDAKRRNDSAGPLTSEKRTFPEVTQTSGVLAGRARGPGDC